MKTSAKYIITILTVFVLTAACMLCTSAKTYYGSDGSISWSVDLNSSHMTVSGTGAMEDYENHSSLPYAKFLPVIKTLEIRDGITSVGSCAFIYAANLEKVTLADSITSIGQSAFEYCAKLKEINIPSNVNSIGNMAFSSCRALEELTLPDTLSFLGEYAFCDCQALTRINIPDSVTDINNGTFSGCLSLESVSGLNNVQYIGNGAFYNCKALNFEKFPQNVTEVSPRAFFGCSSFDVLVPSTALTPDGAFYNTGALFNVIWNIDGKSVTSQISVNAIPSYDGTPKKNSVLDGIYSFSGWNKAFTPAVTAQNEYKAVFSLAKPIISASYEVKDGNVNASCLLNLENVTAQSSYILFACYDADGNMICSKRTVPQSDSTSASASLFLKGRTAHSVKAYIYTDSDFLTPLGQCVAAQEI